MRPQTSPGGRVKTIWKQQPSGKRFVCNNLRPKKCAYFFVVKPAGFPYFRRNCTVWCRADMVCPAARWCRKENKQTINNKQHRRNQMKFNKWTLGLAAVGVVSLASAARADEKMSQVQTALSNTTLSGYVDVAAS